MIIAAVSAFRNYCYALGEAGMIELVKNEEKPHEGTAPARNMLPPTNGKYQQMKPKDAVTTLKGISIMIFVRECAGRG